MMIDMMQEILVYITLGIAVVYLLWKFLLPKRLLASKKTTKNCGQDDCGCH